MSATYLVKRNGVESGPYNQEHVLTLLDGGHLSPSDMVCFARKWRWLGRDHWFPVEWLSHPPSLRDIRIPRSTAIIWACIAAVLLALVIIRVLQK
jgi:hypothetical protein